MKFFTGILAAMVACVCMAGEKKFSQINADKLDEMMNDKLVKVTIFDANTEKTRKVEGVIPGAHLLKNVSNFAINSDFPSDKKAPVVFYCANTECTASHSAATRAMEKGFTNVSVMVDGIEGWKKAGKKTVVPSI